MVMLNCLIVLYIRVLSQILRVQVKLIALADRMNQAMIDFNLKMSLEKKHI
jgi:hypothetical protein